MKIRIWALNRCRLTTIRIFLGLTLFLTPAAIATTILIQKNKIAGTVVANRATLVSSLQTGDILAMDKALSSYSLDSDISYYRVTDKFGRVVREAPTAYTSSSFFGNTFPLYDSNSFFWGNLELEYKIPWNSFAIFEVITLSLVGLICMIFFGVSFVVLKSIISPIEKLAELEQPDGFVHFSVEIDEIQHVFSKLENSYFMKLSSERVAAKYNEDQALLEMAKRVVHDIRSPITAFAVIVDRANLGDDMKNLAANALERMNHICSEILKNPVGAPKSLAGIGAAIASIVEEKKLNTDPKYLSFNNLTSHVEDTVPDMEFYSVISNLIQNSIEAFDKGGGSIQISAQCTETETSIIIQDEGKGIPPNVLYNLGKRPVTFGKGTYGNGLGYFHAKKWARKNGGDVQIESVETLGTTVKIILPKKAIDVLQHHNLVT
ncbi:MAG: HAMP domain-containing histidine kinase [Bdellovibrionales bacterium]|nr:HAMP domain-containing histidine kinase [Bdellovibrionales bacterium]